MTDRRGWTVGGLVCAVLLVAVAACSEPSDSAVEPSCEEQHLASGTGYHYDPAFAIAIAQAIAVGNPELTGVVDAVAEYQKANPDDEALAVTSDSTRVDVGLNYVLSLVILTAEPDLATPTLLATMRRAADEAGMHGISVLLSTDRHAMSDDVGPELQLLRDHLSEQTFAGPEGPVALPVPACTEDDSGR